MKRPSDQEFNPYYGGYVSKVPEGDIIHILEQQLADYLSFYQGIPTDKWDYAYAEGKWTIKELMLHLLDAERVFAYRALRISRGDQTPLAGFDQDLYVPNSKAANRSISSILEEYEALRKSTIQLFKNFSSEVYGHLGTASNSPVSVRALAYIISGHEIHHANIIKEKYLD